MKLNVNEQKELIDLCSQMITIPSLSGHEDGMVRLIKAYMEKHGFDEVFTDRYGNILGCIRGNRPGKHILFDGHIDTVPAENAADWHSAPFTPTIKDGKLYGRGASDMKGADAAMLYALGRFAKKSGKNFAGELWFAGVVHEECFEGVSAREISRRVQPDLVIIGEASEMNLKCSQRGRAEIKLETFGVPCHSSNPGKGVNAVYAMMKAVEKFRALSPIRQEGMAGDGIMELTDIISEPFPGKSVVPHYCAVTFDRRLLVGETRESVLAPLRKILDELSAEDPTFRAKVSFTEGSEACYTGETIAADRFFPSWREDPENPLVQRIYREICSRGYSPELTGYSFCTNGSHYGGEAGIPCLGIGPGREELAHIIDEYVPLEDLINIADFYDAVCEASAAGD